MVRLTAGSSTPVGIAAAPRQAVGWQLGTTNWQNTAVPPQWRYMVLGSGGNPLCPARASRRYRVGVRDRVLIWYCASLRRGKVRRFLRLGHRIAVPVEFA